MNKNLQRFEEKSIPKLIFRNVIPAIVAMIMVVVYNMADMFFIGQTNDPLQVAAVSLATPVFMIVMALASIFGVGGTSLISRSFGEGKKEYAKKVSSFCFWCVSVIGAVLSIVFFVFAEQIAVFLGASAATLEYLTSYLRIFSTSFIFMLISSAFSNILRAEGNPGKASMGMLIGNIVNIILDPIFILVFDMGIAGAALATVIGNISAGLFYILHFAKKDSSVLSINPKDFTLKDSVPKNVFVIGIPVSIAGILMSASNVILNGIMASYNDLAVAGIGVAMKVLMIPNFICMGFGQGLQPIFGYTYGAKNYSKFKDIMKFSLIIAFTISVTMTAFSYLAVEPIVSGFLTEQAAFDYAVNFTRILLTSSSIFGIFFVFVNALQAIGAAKSSLIINISRQGLIYVPMIFILNAVIGVNGIVAAQPVTDIISTILVTILYFIARKRMLKD